MKVAHLLRKYCASEWGGTETALLRLAGGLRAEGVDSILFAPGNRTLSANDPLRDAGHAVRNFRAFLPVWGLRADQREQLFAIGGNIMSWNLLPKLLFEPGLSVIHTHALNRLGGIGLRAARLRGLPLVVSIHGGVLDLPDAVMEHLTRPLRGGIEWGKVLGVILGSRRLLALADAILTCNPREAELLAEKHPGKRIMVQPHGVPVAAYRRNHRATAEQAFSALRGRCVFVALGRIDPVKNQAWLASLWPALLAKAPDALLVLAGPVTDQAYAKLLRKEIRNLGLESHVLLVGALPPDDPRLIGLLQVARAVLVPSISETFALSIIEAWAAGALVISTATSGARALIKNGENGLLFDLEDRSGFMMLVERSIANPAFARQLGHAGQSKARLLYDSSALAGRVRELYEELISPRA